MEYVEGMGRNVKLLSHSFGSVKPRAGDDVTFEIVGQTKEEITGDGTYYVQYTVTVTGSDAGNYTIANDGKFGFSQDITSVEIFKTEDYTVNVVAQNIATVVSDMTMSGSQSGVFIPQLPDGFEVTINVPEASRGVIDSEGNRISGTVLNDAEIEYIIIDNRDAQNPVTTTVTGKVDIPALDKFDVTVSTANGTVAGSGEYTMLDSVTLTATPEEGYVFSQWLVNGQVASTDATYTFTLLDHGENADDLEVIALFEQYTQTPGGNDGGSGGGGGGGSTVYYVTFNTTAKKPKE